MLKRGFRNGPDIRSFRNRFARKGGFTLLEDPRVSSCRTRDHDTVDAGFPLHCKCLFGTVDVSASDDRNRYRLLDLPNAVPVGLTGIKLSAESSVNGNSRGTGRFAGFCNLRRIFPGKALPDFDGHGLRLRLHHRIHNLKDKRRVFHQSRTFSVIYHLRDGAAHVDIEKIEFPVGKIRRLLRHDCRVASEQLQGNRVLPGHRLKQLFGIPVSVHDALGADHFRIQKTRSVLLADKPEREVRNAGHRPERRVRFNCHISDAKTHALSFRLLCFA